MKKSVEIQGLPIFSLVDGIEIGHVKQLVVNPEAGQVELFLVENDQDAIGVHVLPYTSVIGVGDFAVTVETGTAIQELANVPGARDLMLRGYKVIGTRVLSRKGQLLGSVNEYFVDEDNGTITTCSFVESEDTASIKLFDRPNIMTFGRDVIVIKEQEHIFNSFSERDAATTAVGAPSEQSPAPAADPAVTEATQAAEEVATTAQVVAVGPYAYLVGKVLREDLLDEAGAQIAPQGTALTAELIERVKSLSPTLFMKLNRLAE
ncbi:MAG: PRC-barrel domain-containing protein [Tumebacillaceae bacterium]